MHWFRNEVFTIWTCDPPAAQHLTWLYRVQGEQHRTACSLGIP